ncbi:unnamed protein product [Cuscuta epithymum]|uniref:Sororin C-terminal region domain-containing protein n=1 Tax=Cuscuta epithymum TaxID=186058 RepID=A0AAV0FVM9_9ASTE|nr:unnamed protein product [Cuscuta epithymum]
MNTEWNPNSLRRDPNSKTTVANRVPFTDISNFNITPIETLRKLCSSSTTNASSAPSFGTYSSSTESTILKSPISVLLSDTSVGSSSPVLIQNARKLGLSAPLRIPVSSRSSHSTSGSADGEPEVYGQSETLSKPTGESDATVFHCSTIRKNKRGKVDVVSDGSKKDCMDHASQLSVEKKKNKGKQSISSPSSPPPKGKKDRRIPCEKDASICDKIMANELSDAPIKCSTLRKTRGRRKLDNSVFSCPPLPRTRNNRSKAIEAGEAESLGSLTDPNKKLPKKRSSGKQQPFNNWSFDKDFVEKQKAYFKEIDDFELEVEEDTE